MKNKKRALFNSVISLILCFSMLLTTTFAWFTDSVTTGINTIAAGTLDVELYHTNAAVTDERVNATTKLFMDLQGDPILWEPGVVSYENLRVANEGDLALIYQLAINTENENHVKDPSGTMYGLSQILKVGVVEGGITATDRAGVVASVEDGNWTTLANFFRGGSLLPEGEGEDEKTWGIVVYWEQGENDNYWNLNNGKQLDTGDALSIDLGIQLIATQEQYEEDSFGNDYDATAKTDTFPVFNASGSVTTTVKPNDQNQTSEQVVMTTGQISAAIPAGVQLNAGTTALTMSVTEKNESDANLTLGENEALRSLDVHIEGVDEENTVPMIIDLGEIMPKGLNEGNVKLYHVEKGASNGMTRVDTVAELDAHNEYYYDPATGRAVVAMATFSEIAMVADTENAWNGEFKYEWYDSDKIELIIANADQLAGLGQLVSEGNSFSGKNIKLINDINMGGENVLDENGKLKFYPIGYTKDGYKGEFSGTFDGTGHKISDIYQNTWMLVGTYDGTYYNAAMGLFGYVNGGTVKNLTVDNFKSEGEFAPTGCVAAYAANATFENIAIINSHPQTYNTSVAAVVGRDGKNGLNNNDGYNLVFRNITVDSSNTVSALWGSWDVGAAGLLGYLGADSKVLFENCNVAATIDVYNDVCGNYQYYWYRYCGAYIGTVDKRLDNGQGALDLSNVTAENCTVDFGDRHDYYYCEFEKNTQASYTEDFQFSRVPHSEIKYSDRNDNGKLDAGEATGCTHTHTANEDKQAVYIPFRQLFGGYGWGVDGVDEYENIDITSVTNVKKFEKNRALKDGYLYRVGNQNAFPIGKLFQEISNDIAVDSGVYVSVTPLVEDVTMTGTFVKKENWEESTLHITGDTGLAKLTIQDYNSCKPFELIVEVIDAKNIISAEGTTTGGTFVMLCNINSSSYVNYWNATLYGNGFTYSLQDAPTAYNSKQGHGVIIVKNAILDNVRIVGDVYNSYGVYTSQNYYNAAVDVIENSIIRNCYIANCATPVKARSNVTIENTTLYGGAVANLIIMSGTITLQDVTTANYADGRSTVGLGIAIHPDATEGAKLILNGTLTQYNYICEANKPNDSNAMDLYEEIFSDQCEEYHYGSTPNRYINAGIVSMSEVFDMNNIEDNANTGYSGKTVSLIGSDGYLYSEKNPSSVNNNYSEPTIDQSVVAPSYAFDFTVKNYVPKQDSSNDYCYEENGTVKISMDAGETFNWDTSILTVTKAGKELDYKVAMNGVDYTGKSIAFNTAGIYIVSYTYTDNDNYKLDLEGNITTYSITYTKSICIEVSVVEETTKHAEFKFGSSDTATEKITIGNRTFVTAKNVEANNSTWASMTIEGQKVYYPIVAAKLTSTKGSSSFAYFPVFDTVVSITDYEGGKADGNKVEYGASTKELPSTLSAVKGYYTAYSDGIWSKLSESNLNQTGPNKIFKWASGSDAPDKPTTYDIDSDNVKELCYKSPSIEADRDKYITLVQYTYTDEAKTTYYYYVGYTLDAFDYQNTCFTPDTMITLADGTQKRVDELTFTDKILAWDFFTGSYVEKDIALLVNHGEENYQIANLEFSDGNVLRIIGDHGIFDHDQNKFVYLTVDNMHEYIGHRFVKYATDGNYDIVSLTNAFETEEYTSAWSITSADSSNAFASGLLTVAPPEDFYNWIEMGDKLIYDVEQFQKDVETYGLYTYDDFKEYVTYEQFIDWNGAYLKVAVEKGYFTFDYIIELIELYKGWMPKK